MSLRVVCEPGTRVDGGAGLYNETSPKCNARAGSRTEILEGSRVVVPDLFSLTRWLPIRSLEFDVDASKVRGFVTLKGRSGEKLEGVSSTRRRKLKGTGILLETHVLDSLGCFF